jgi:hypothetical protein
MDKFLNNVKYNLLNSIEMDVISEDGEEPFAYITDKARDNFANVLREYLINLIIGYNTFMEKDTNVLELKDYLVSNNIEFQSNNLEMMKQKIKLALDYYLENS